MRQPLNIIWFKRDLRIADHRPLAQAAAAGTGPVLPLYIAEPELWAQADT
jgi:deoxyribodipyrimidine photo-lyase